MLATTPLAKDLLSRIFYSATCLQPLSEKSRAPPSAWYTTRHWLRMFELRSATLPPKPGCSVYKLRYYHEFQNNQCSTERSLRLVLSRMVERSGLRDPSLIRSPKAAKSFRRFRQFKQNSIMKDCPLLT